MMVRDARKKSAFPTIGGKASCEDWMEEKTMVGKEKAYKEHCTLLSLWTASNGGTLEKRFRPCTQYSESGDRRAFQLSV